MQTLPAGSRGRPPLSTTAAKRVRILGIVETMGQELRFGARLLFKHPLLALAAISSLGLGIGATTGVFSLIDALLLRPFPVHRPAELVSVQFLPATAEAAQDVSAPDYEALRASGDPFGALIAYSRFDFSIRAGDVTERVTGQLVSGNFFDVLGVQFATGRGFSPEEDTPGAIPVVVISHELAQRRFSNVSSALGEDLLVNGLQCTIVGVVDEEFRGVELGGDPDVFLPLASIDRVWPRVLEFWTRDAPGPTVLARWPQGQARAHGEAALAAYALERDGGTQKGSRFVVVPFADVRVPETERDRMGPFLATLLGVVVLVLLIACSNVASLTLIRLVARQGELSVRRALGASEVRLARLLLGESLVLYGAGLGAGLLMAHWTISLFRQLHLFQPMLTFLDVRLDHRVFLFAALISFLGSVLFGLMPLLWSSQSPAAERSAVGVRSRGARIRKLSLAVQVAFSTVLLVGAVLLLGTLQRAYTMDPGFRVDNVLFVSVDLMTMEYEFDEASGRALYRDALTRIQSIPGVRSAAWAADIPFERLSIYARIATGDEAQGDEPDWSVQDADIVSPGYFRTMGIPLLQGRDFTLADDEHAPGVAIINETMAERLWPGQYAIGARVRIQSRSAVRHEWYEVVGIARDAKYHTPWEEPIPYLYLPLAQRYFWNMNLHVHVDGEPLSYLPAVRAELATLAPELPLFNARPVHEELDVLLARQRTTGSLLVASAMLALFLTGVGIYSTAAHAAAQRSAEVGLRMALGAERRQVLGLILREGIFSVLVGLVAGAVGAHFLGRFIESLFIDANHDNLLAIVAASAVVLSTAALATYAPAYRAARIDPAQALHHE